MSILDFQSTFAHLPVISISEIEKAFPGFDRNALTRWQKKGYLQKIRRGLYRLTNRPIRGDADLFFIANRMYLPSYISLQSALRWYDFIPEGVFSITSVSTLKTAEFQTAVGHYTFRHIKPALFWGYTLVPYGEYRFKMANPAKALLDYLYLHPQVSSADHFNELRLNMFELQDKLNRQELEKYLNLFDSKSLRERTQRFIQFIEKHVNLI